MANSLVGESRDRLVASGAYRHRVTVQAPTPAAPDGDGGFTQSWTDADPPTWAVSITVAPRRDGEMAIAGTTIATGANLVRGRYRRDITTATRLGYEGRVFNILTVRDLDERHRVLELVCAEVVA
jgi:SPP1 family predicted phage head-tail adaptor